MVESLEAQYPRMPRYLDSPTEYVPGESLLTFFERLSNIVEYEKRVYHPGIFTKKGEFERLKRLLLSDDRLQTTNESWLHTALLQVVGAKSIGEIKTILFGAEKLAARAATNATPRSLGVSKGKLAEADEFVSPTETESVTFIHEGAVRTVPSAHTTRNGKIGDKIRAPLPKRDESDRPMNTYVSGRAINFRTTIGGAHKICYHCGDLRHVLRECERYEANFPLEFRRECERANRAIETKRLAKQARQRLGD
jgi:hypothetical protein